MRCRWLLCMLVSVAALGIVGKSPVQAQQAQQEELSLAWVPADAPGMFAVIGVLPDRLDVLPGVAQLKKQLARDLEQDNFPIRPGDVRQIVMVGLFDPERPEPGSDSITGGYVLHLKKPPAADKWQAWMEKGTQKRWKQWSYYVLSEFVAIAAVNNGRTVLMAGGPRAEEALRLMLAAGPQGAQQAAWAKRMRSLRLGKDERTPRLSQLPFVAYFHSPAIRKALPAQEEVVRESGPLAASVLLLLRKPQAIFFGSNFGPDKLELAYVLVCEEEPTAEQLSNILRGLIATGQLMLGSLERPEAGEEQARAIRMLRAILRKVKVTRSESNVILSLALDKQEVRALGTVLSSAAQGARMAGRRAHSQNNLRQLGIAIHNFHDRHRRLPPAAARQWNGRKLKHPVSWRVLILPYLGEGELYRQYRFDEPWDSPNNLKVLKQMPEVFRHPYDDPDSTHTSYFVLVGPGTVFDPQVEQMTFGRITDGTANTLMIVEAKRKVPWTKPEDIPFDPEKPPPKLGGWFPQGFNAAFCDASVRLLPNDIAARTLRLLILRNDGQVVEPP